MNQNTPLIFMLDHGTSFNLRKKKVKPYEFLNIITEKSNRKNPSIYGFLLECC